MSDASRPSQVSFPCEHCQQVIYVAVGLPATSAPCPHCGEEVTSPVQMKSGATVPLPPLPSKNPEIVRLEPELERELPKAQGVHQPAVDDTPAVPFEPVEPVYVGGKKRRGNPATVILVVGVLVLAGGLTFWFTQNEKKEEKKPARLVSAPVSEVIPKKPEVEKPVEVEPLVKKNEGDRIEKDAQAKKVARAAWLKNGWKKDASAVLAAFTSAKTPKERLKHVIPNEGVMDEIRMYYSGGNNDANTPAEFFTHIMGSQEDRRRGIFMMQYRQPARLDIREYFTPIVSQKVTTGAEETSLMEMAQGIEEDELAQPIGINAFFKEIDGELKLDSAVFIQGKYRTFKLFTSYAQPGTSKTFRVVVSESLSHRYRNDPDIRTYRFEDIAYPADFISIPVEVESDAGQVLSLLNWHGENRNRIYKTATVELEWTDERPSKLRVKKIVCWEFLGVGGEIGNTLSEDDTIKESDLNEGASR